MKMTNEKIMVGIDDEIIELLGDDKIAFLADRAITAEREATRKAAQMEKDMQRAALLERLGLTADEAKLLIG